MKKLINLVLFLISLSAYSQIAPPTDYTAINMRYDWLAGKFEAISIPAFNGVPVLQAKQFTGAGALGVDSINNRMYFYSSGSFIRVANYSEIPSGSGVLNIDTTYNRLATRFDSAHAVLKSLQIIQNSTTAS